MLFLITHIVYFIVKIIKFKLKYIIYNNMDNKVLFIILGVLVVVLIVIVILYYHYKNKLDDMNLDSNNTEPEKKCIVKGKEVFNVGNNMYTYEEAKNVCKAMDGELASLEQVFDSYKDGADWCNYGWIKGQMAVYPTQQFSFDEKQKGPVKKRLECGLPGVNGGYFENDKFLFGANCYGKKPIRKKSEDNALKDMLVDPANHNNHVSKANTDNLEILPFNKDRWSQ
jgi:hypothetical protein